ncbi:MAG: PEGA domain-containing protein [Deltaproteobacteria bacterium]|nr:PEGA domain-containing protein [Deltaproteobacteria bacterium]
MTDDESPIGIDLEAWAPPAPPRGIADGVIARMQESVRAAELQAMPRSHRRWWIAGGVAAAAVASVVVLGVWGVQRAPANGSGTVVAERPRHLELGPTSAELDANAEVRWRRDGHRLAIEQVRGAATWRIDDADTVVIDAGAMGASVEATGASLRVEVSMKQPEVRSDEGVEERARSARMIGASALTAAAVALVTVVVYEGRVKVTNGGQTIALAPGTSYEVRPAYAPREQLTVGAAPAQVSDLEERVRILEAQLAEQRARTVDPAPDVVDKTVSPDKPAGTDKLEGKKQVDPFARSRGDAVDSPDRSEDDVVDPFGSRTGSRVDPFSSPRTQKVTCDAETLGVQGRDLYSAGSYAEALVKYEQAIRCKPSRRLELHAFMAACNAKNVRKAGAYYAKLSPDTQQIVLSVCVRNNISARQLSAASRGATGRLSVASTPVARVAVDGVDVGKSPVALDLAPGKHKVTFTINGDRHTFSVTVEAGKTVTLRKQL